MPALLALLALAAAAADPSSAPADAPAGAQKEPARGFIPSEETLRPVSSGDHPEPVELVPPPAPGTVKTGLDWLVVPLVSYDSDEKLGLGAAAQFQWYGKVQPYRHQLTAQVFLTTGGLQSHWVRYDAPSFLGTQLRFWARAEYRAELNMPWYGVGNLTSDALADHPELAPDRAFVWHRQMPYGRLGVSYPLRKGVFAFATATYKHTDVGLYPGSLLALERPRGVGGGLDLRGDIGFYVDLRDREASPTQGWYFEASLRGAGPPSTDTFFGANIRDLRFGSLTKWLVLATRLELDWLSAAAPFHELAYFGGVDAVDGVGGQYSARGIPKDRYVGRMKFIGTAELRSHVWNFTFFDEPISFGPVAFVDIGRVWSFAPGDGSFWAFHPAYGGGIRLWRRSFVVRIDMGTSQARPFSLYVLFGQFF